MAERRAGQFLVDVLLGAPGATYNSFYRGKALAPLSPALVLPEVTDLSKWWKDKHRYVDAEGQYVFIYQSTLYGPPVYSNTKLVSLDSLRSVWDLLDPKWKGKMIALWPRANYVSTALLFMRLLQSGDVIINEIEASWIGYRAQAVQPVFVDVIHPVQAELIKVQREIFNRILENLKPGVTVGELAQLSRRTAESAAPKTGPAAGARGDLTMRCRI